MVAVLVSCYRDDSGHGIPWHGCDNARGVHGFGLNHVTVTVTMQLLLSDARPTCTSHELVISRQWLAWSQGPLLAAALAACDASEFSHIPGRSPDSSFIPPLPWVWGSASGHFAGHDAPTTAAVGYPDTREPLDPDLLQALRRTNTYRKRHQVGQPVIWPYQGPGRMA